jgi:ribosomal protein S18 acetylase RimI-like enzyme
MNIRQINNCDGDLVAGLFDRYRIFYRQPSDLALARRYIQARLDNNESKIFAALVEDIAVGFTQLYPNYSSLRAAKNWILNDLYVEPAYRQQKIGRALIRTAIDFARQEGAKFVQLETAGDNFIAQALYEKLGFIRQLTGNSFYTYQIIITE